MATTKKRGDYGEHIACRYLEQRGYAINARNYMPAHGIKRGEIDIVAQKDGVVHFVEVKTRFMCGRPGVDPPEARITQAKLRALNRTAQTYLKEKNMESVQYVFDALSIIVSVKDRCARVRFMMDIFL